MPATRLFWWACSVVLLAAAVFVYVQGRSAAELHADAVQDAKARTTAQPAPSRSAPTGSPTPAPSNRAAVPTSGPGVSMPGTSISARIAGPDTIDVTESLRLAAPTSRITITPPDVADAGTEFANVTPVLDGAQISAGGQMVSISTDRVDSRLEVDLPAPTTAIEVRYLLTSGIARTVPSKAGRALAALGPVLDAQASTPVAYTLGGDEFIGVSCPQLGVTQYACASGAPGRLAVAEPLPRATSLVLLQINLPSL